MITRLPLDGGRWVDVKNRLKVKDGKEVHTYSVDGMATDGQTYRFNIVKHRIATAAVRIVNWGGFTDDAGKPLAWPAGQPFKARVDVIEGLDQAEFDTVIDAVTEHIKAVEAADEAEKKSTAGGETDSTPSSTSAA